MHEWMAHIEKGLKKLNWSCIQFNKNVSSTCSVLDTVLAAAEAEMEKMVPDDL